MSSSAARPDYTVEKNLYVGGKMYLGGIDILTLFGGTGAPMNAEYILYTPNGLVPNSRVLSGTVNQITATTGLTDVTLSLAAAGAGAGVYTFVSDVTLDAYGRVTALTSYGAAPQAALSAGAGDQVILTGTTIRSLSSTANIAVASGGGVSPVTMDLTNTTVVAGAYAYPSSVTFDAKGRATAAVAGIAPAPVNSPYLCVGNDGILTNERGLVIQAPLSAADGGANASYTVGLQDQVLTPGTYGPATVTVTQKGLISAISGPAAGGVGSSATLFVTAGGGGVDQVILQAAGWSTIESMFDGVESNGITASITPDGWFIIPASGRYRISFCLSIAQTDVWSGGNARALIGLSINNANPAGAHTFNCHPINFPSDLSGYQTITHTINLALVAADVVTIKAIVDATTGEITVSNLHGNFSIERLS